MNRTYSYNWIREYVATDVAAAEFAREMSLKSQTIDRVYAVEPIFQDVVTAKILAIKPHPNADKLQLAKLETGRGEQEVVCGAPNIAVGQIVPLVREGGHVRSGKTGDEILTVKKVSIRGVESNGMICSQFELGLSEDHQGIWVLPPDTPIGKKLTELMDFDDSLFEIEITSNRPDASSIVGIGHEAAAVLQTQFKPKTPPDTFPVENEKAFTLSVEEPKLCPRYQAVVMTGVAVKPAPIWMQQRLLQSGIRPINNLVDITNYVLLELGQPMHVFDYDKLHGQSIVVRKAKANESLQALDGNRYELAEDQLVIADQDDPVAIAGVMGGQESAVDQDTTTIVFESANFNPLSVRKTARALDLHSESSALFEKGLHAHATQIAILRAIELTQELAGGQVSSQLFDERNFKYEPTVLRFDTRCLKRYLGLDVPPDTASRILRGLGFGVEGETELMVTVPWWREGDIQIEQDIVEEVARVFGYDNLSAELPAGQPPMPATTPLLRWEDNAKDILLGLGATELLTYSMVSESMLGRIGFDPKQALALANPLSEELAFMRPTLLAGVLDAIGRNARQAEPQMVFELSNIYLPTEKRQLPEERSSLTVGVVGPDDSVFMTAKGMVETVLSRVGVRDVTFQPTESKCPVWNTRASLDVYSGQDFLGVVGMALPSVTSTFSIDQVVAMVDLNFSAVAERASDVTVFESLPVFPGIERDLALVLDVKHEWESVVRALRGQNPLLVSMRFLSTYRNEALGVGNKSLAFRLTFRADDRTLKSEEVDNIVEKLVHLLQEKFGASLR